MTAKKLQLAPIDGADVLAVLDRRLRELEARRLVVTELIIESEKTVGVGRGDAGVADAERAEALLGGGQFIVSREKRISPLAELHAERDLIDAALDIGRSRKHRLATELAGEIWASYFAEISEIERRRVFAALELQTINRRREALRDKITAAGGAGFLSTDGVDLLGFEAPDQEQVRWAAERLIADGIATRREIEKAMSNG